MPPEPEPPEVPGDRELADLLDACLEAERAAPGSAVEIIHAAPPHLRADLEQLLSLARAVQSVDWDLVAATGYVPPRVPPPRRLSPAGRARQVWRRVRASMATCQRVWRASMGRLRHLTSFKPGRNRSR